MSETATADWDLVLSDEAATRAFAGAIGDLVGANDLVTLAGELGAGKTTFARALIRHVLRDEGVEVPSPAFTLMQVYEGPAFPIVHADLYRIDHRSELAELGWEEASDGALVVVEWAERAGDALAADRLDIRFSLVPGRDNARGVHVTGEGGMAARLARARAVRSLFERSGFDKAERHFMLGDASTRAYERLTKQNGETAILMISPPRPDGPPIRFGRSYSTIARLAETIEPFLAMGTALAAEGLSPPKILAADAGTGLAIIEDLGTEGVVGPDGPILERYIEAVSVLATLHGRALPDTFPGYEERPYRLPPYDLDAMLIEVELLADWYVPHIQGNTLSSGQRATFINLWRQALIEIVSSKATWTLRDYHSPNLLWLAERQGQKRVGLIDFQDAVMGHPAYDVASLAQDARVDVADETELRLLSHYARARRAETPDFDMAGFARAYAILGAQRSTKILGIFARLEKRDGKPQYRVHLPRIARYLRKNLAHPALGGLRGWFEEHLPTLTDA